ncbi:MAG: NAD+ synthase [Candidatus Thermoplasmatota archaeon]
MAKPAPRTKGEGVGSGGAVTVVDGPARWETVIAAFLRHAVAQAGAKGVVVGVSGGLDSAVVAALAARTLGKERVLAIMLPAPDSNPQDAEHARLGCTAFGLSPITHSIGPIVAGLEQTLGYTPAPRERGNAKARARMTLLYAEAARHGFLVLGTGNKSELLTGYFTKHGDGGVDLQPIGDLYKTQVRELGRFLGIPKPILDKPPSAGLYAGQTDEGDMGLTYDQLDACLRQLELNHDAATAARKSGLPVAMVEDVDSMVRRTEHKRSTPLIPKLGARTVGIDWRRSVQWDG